MLLGPILNFKWGIPTEFYPDHWEQTLSKFGSKHKFSFEKMHFKMLFVKLQLLDLGLNLLMK